MMQIMLILMLFMMTMILVILFKYSVEISKIKLLGKNRIMHNVCYTDNVNYSQAHGNSEPHV